ncbi:Predicted small secreted protein [Amphibacillus marinus]|uniref:Predicted small secreted protein n=1 Tax=Amphibacillus marinus TaxID=872970 RepID=A0A1H8SZG7_9BACI|nr:PepSY domain-containing protein [Amphibacillus marinus]SEO83906.1 Predicted small secreted protein [Amphibacillus marinus]
MNWKKSIIALTVGVAIGYSIKAQLNQMPIRPEVALKQAKNMFKERGTVSGSWIYMKTESVSLHGLDYTVYRGGISRSINEVNKQYEFFVDAFTGTVIATKETNTVI